MTQPRARTLTLLLLAIALGIVLRLWFIRHAAVLAGDTLLYGDIALSWMRQGVYGFSQPPLAPIPTLIRLPGYPLFLMLCFRLFGLEHYTAVLNLQCVIDVFACLLLGALVRRLFGTRAALVALFLSTLCPFTASYTAAALTETLTCATIVIAFYALERWRLEAAPTHGIGSPWNRWLWVLSAVLGYSILLRPDQGLLAVAVLPAVFYLARARFAPEERARRERRLLPALAAALCTLLPLLPWTIRNARTFHVFQPLAPRSAVDSGEPVPLGFNRWYRSWGVDFSSTEDVYWNYDGAPIQMDDIPARAFDSPAQFTETAAVLSDYNLTAKPSPELDKRFDTIAEERIRAHPIRFYVTLPVARLANMLFRPRVEMLPIPLSWWRWREHPGQTAFALAYGALNLAYFVFGALGLYRWLRRPDDPTTPIAWALAAYIVLRCMLLLTLDNSEPRYTLEFLPILILATASLFRRPAVHPSGLASHPKG